LQWESNIQKELYGICYIQLNQETQLMLRYPTECHSMSPYISSLYKLIVIFALRRTF